MFNKNSILNSTSCFFLVLIGIFLSYSFLLVEIKSNEFDDPTRYDSYDPESGRMFCTSWFQLTEQEKKLFYSLFLHILPAVISIGTGIIIILPGSLISDSAEKLKTLIIKLSKIFPIIISFVFFFTLILILIFITQNQLLTDDEEAYFFQAKLFSKGYIYSKPPPLGEFFSNIFIAQSPVWFSTYPPGNSLMLSLGILSGDTKFIPPLVGGITLCFFYLLVRRLYSTITALISTILLFGSPFFLLTSSTYLSQPSSLMFITISCFILTKRHTHPVYPIFSGLLAGLSFTVRYVDSIVMNFSALIIALIFDMFARQQAYRSVSKLLRIKWILYYIVGTLVVLISLFLYNKKLTGDGFLLPDILRFIKIDRECTGNYIGFGPSILGIVHSPLKGFSNIITGLIRLNFWLFGWPISFLPILFLLLIRKNNDNTQTSYIKNTSKDFFLTLRTLDFALFIPTTALICFLFFIPYNSSSDTGPIYYYPLLLPLCIQSARGLEKLAGFLKSRQKYFPIYIIYVYLALFIIFNILTFFRINAKNIYNLSSRINEPYKFVESSGIKEGLIFMYDLQTLYNQFRDSSRFYPKSPDPWMKDKIIYAKYIPDKIAKLQEQFPEKKAYILSWKPFGFRKKQYYLQEISN